MFSLEDFKTFPKASEMHAGAQRMPMAESDSLVPYAVWYEGLLDAEMCDYISVAARNEDPYKHNDCNAFTRELPDNNALTYIDTLTRVVNDRFFGFDLHEGHMTWHQTYTEGSSYQLHADQAPGISRKLTAIVMLSDPRSYTHGFLKLLFPPVEEFPPIAQGTVIWIQPWLLHEVEPVSSGHRETINMGFYGPPFK